MEMVNGYVFLDLTKTNVYAKALKVLESGKPVVVKDGSGAPYFVDSMNVDGTNVVITKGGKTVTIANDNTITSVGDVQNHLYNNICKINFDDANANSCYAYVKFLTNYELNDDNIIDYIKTIIQNYECTGYNSDSNLVYLSFYYRKNTNDIFFETNDDTGFIILLTDESLQFSITSIQLF